MDLMISADCTFKYIGNSELTSDGTFYDHTRISMPENPPPIITESSTPDAEAGADAGGG